MYYTTGFTKSQILAICELVLPADPHPRKKRGRKQKLGLYEKIAAVLTYLNRNRTEWDIAEQYGVDQATISRVIADYTPVVEAVLREWVPTADDLDPSEQLIVDGSLLPCWSWADHPEDYSGKHHTTGRNVQIAVSLAGDLRWVSDPQSGSTHDSEAIRRSGLLDGPDGKPHSLGDKGYIGLGMITPYRKPPGGELAAWQKEFNTAVNKIRYVVERAIANLKTWRILHTDYRRPHDTHSETISTVLALVSYRASLA
jgi:hypothetical protein